MQAAREMSSSALQTIRDRMRALKLDALWVRSTDRYLNEYVPTEESTRVWLTGFSGSVGEAIVTLDAAFVFVDGRYYLQADQEVDATQWTVVRVPLGKSIELEASEKLAALKPKRVGYESERFSVDAFQALEKKHSVEWVQANLVEEARGPVEVSAKPIRAVDEAKLDQTAAEKIQSLSFTADAYLVQTLDEIAWLSNLRGDDLPFQATFRSIALVHGGRMAIATDMAPASLQVLRKNAIDFVSFDAFVALIKSKASVAYDPKTTTMHGLSLIENERVPMPSPIGPLKAKKGPKELKAMQAAFAKADKVIDQAQSWLCTEVAKGAKVSEADFADKVEQLFTASGATGLSFKVISAAGKNGAVIHYSHPNKKRIIRQGELMLLDTGAYYAEGYATDLTRTFLVGPKSQKATAEQRRYFTLVLKCAIAGMRARIPVGTRGDQLDAITRAPLWQAGFNYNHGTGHGVGINVHEFPPRIGPQGTGVLEEAMVFSIEPGVYLEKFGGVRIENLCTLERIKGVPGFLQVKPLTFSPLDVRLIEKKLLNDEEVAWLASYQRKR